MKKKQYKRELKRLQNDLVHLQRHIEHTKQKVVILFEGRDSSGKGSMIKRLVDRLNPRYVRVVAKGKPTPQESRQNYFTRWHKILPQESEIVILDRSWYTRAGVESVMGFASEKQVDSFLGNVNDFETYLNEKGVIIIKYWLSISHKTQEERFHIRLNDIRKRWKLSEMDLQSRDKFDEYTKAKERMFEVSHTRKNPWHVIDSNNKREARLICFRHLLSQFNYMIEEYEPRSLPSIVISNKASNKFNNLIIQPNEYGVAS